MYRSRLRHPALIFGLPAALAVLVFLLTSGCGDDDDDRSEFAFPVQTFEDQGREHLAPGQTFDAYNSNPPTSGPHAPAPADWGVHDQSIPKEVPVHNMEHGGVVIWYDCSAGAAPLAEAGCQELRDELAAVVASNRPDKLVLMTPYAGMDSRIALTAWQTLDTLDQFDGGRVQAFIDSFERLFNPEGF